MSEEIRTALVRVIPFAVALSILFIAYKLKKIDAEQTGLKEPQSWKAFVVWVIGFLIFALGVEFTLYHFGLLEIDQWNHSFYPSVIRIVGAVILAPVAEEIIFRGVLLNQLFKKLNSIHIAIFLQAVIFVLLHNFTYENTFSSNLGIAQSLIDAMLFGYARHYTQSLYTPIAMHLTGNLIATLERFVL